MEGTKFYEAERLRQPALVRILLALFVLCVVLCDPPLEVGSVFVVFYFIDAFWWRRYAKWRPAERGAPVTVRVDDRALWIGERRIDRRALYAVRVHHARRGGQLELVLGFGRPSLWLGLSDVAEARRLAGDLGADADLPFRVFTGQLTVRSVEIGVDGVRIVRAWGQVVRLSIETLRPAEEVPSIFRALTLGRRVVLSDAEHQVVVWLTAQDHFEVHARIDELLARRDAGEGTPAGIAEWLQGRSVAELRRLAVRPETFRAPVPDHEHLARAVEDPLLPPELRARAAFGLAGAEPSLAARVRAAARRTLQPGLRVALERAFGADADAQRALERLDRSAASASR